jgi:hypothetical protein
MIYSQGGYLWLGFQLLAYNQLARVPGKYIAELWAGTFTNHLLKTSPPS